MPKEKIEPREDGKVLVKYDSLRDGREAPYTFNAPTTFNLNPGDNYLSMEEAQMVAVCLPALVEAGIIEFDQEVEAKEPERPPETSVTVVKAETDGELMKAIGLLTEAISDLKESVEKLKPTGTKPH